MPSATYIIAEAGVNHNGSLKMARELIDIAVEAGADAVKFQTFKSEKIVSLNAPKAEYQKTTTDQAESQLEMLQKLELKEDDHEQLMQYCQAKGIQFLSTPFDLDSIELLVRRLKLPRLKLSSGELTNAPLLLQAARSGKPLILSTGMCTLGDVEAALGVLAFGYLRPDSTPSIRGFQEAWCSEEGQQVLRQQVILLHCTTEYPAPVSSVNLRAMDTLHTAFGLPVGLSDHTPGILVSLAAVARGAVVIEKHFTIDCNLPGPDHKASLEPHELCALVEGIRMVEAALGSPQKTPAPVEIKNQAIARKSLVAACPIQQGESFTLNNLTVKRPGTGISPLYYWEWLTKQANRNYAADELIV